MIKINRAVCPKCLQKPTCEFVEQDYKRKETIEALSKMQHGKCCYCERKFDVGRTEREVEHYVPKSAFKDRYGNIQWHLANKWENLLYACRTCNSRKGSQLPFNKTTKECEIIDPSCGDIDPEDHIDFVVEDCYITFREKNKSLLGRSTINKLRLTERFDIHSRFRKMKIQIEVHFMNLINALVNDDTTEFTSQKDELSKSMSAHNPFTAFQRSFIAKRLKDLNENGIPRLEQQHRRVFQRITIQFLHGSEVKT